MLKASNCTKTKVEAEIVKELREKEYTLNTVNNYGENLLHIGAANGCLEIVKEILGSLKDRNAIDRKNTFGWTPLMQAIRNGDISTVKLLLHRGSNVNESTYLGMSALGLAAAISKEMFETLYKVCPSALENAANDDISPLCIAAMKNDKELFFHLLDLGMNVAKANEYTHIMMKCSSIPEIRNLARSDSTNDDYWNDITDNIEIQSEEKTVSYNENGNNNIISTHNCPIIINDCELENNNESGFTKYPTNFCSNFLSDYLNFEQLSLISPTLTYNKEEGFSVSPHIRYIENNKSPFFGTNNESVFTFETKPNSKPLTDKTSSSSSQVLQRLQSIRPPDLDITPEELNTTLVGFIPEFSPAKSVGIPSDINDENVFGENTPTPPHYNTPPRGMILNSQQDRMVLILERFGLSHHVPIFLEQEVDMDLFVTLTEDDLVEIGIKHQQDRREVLAVIKECRELELY